MGEVVELPPEEIVVVESDDDVAVWRLAGWLQAANPEAAMTSNESVPHTPTVQPLDGPDPERHLERGLGQKISGGSPAKLAKLDR